jgi:lysyl-tRNA synthetase, class II
VSGTRTGPEPGVSGPPASAPVAQDRAASGRTCPYPGMFDTDATIARIVERHAGLGPDTDTGDRVRILGRIMLVRDHGGVVFFTLQEGRHRLQVLAQRSALGSDGLRVARGYERGDVIGVEGTVGTSRTGELSVLADRTLLLAPSLLPPPAKHQGPRDPGRRVRERELDLIANQASRKVFEVRSAVIHALRTEMHDRGFMEVETPVFATSAGGAVARPFVTHHHALGIDLFMRIAPELHLKRLVVGGFDRVYEIGRVFRNEGIDATHNPEFTILEAYQAPGDYLVMMDLVESLVVAAAREATGTTVVDVGGTQVDLAAPWRRVRMVDAVEAELGVRIEPSMAVEDARAALDRVGISWEPSWGSGRCLVEAFEVGVEAGLVAPTIVMDHPVETSPLARRHRDDPWSTERFEVFVGGRELANAYSELNDPADQRARLEAAAARTGSDDLEVAAVDEEFLRALERGMPPTGGLGIGIDRLVMLLSGSTTVRDVILFPTLRPERGRGRATEGRSRIVPTMSLPTSVRPGAPVAVVRLSGLVRVVAVLTTVVGALTMLSALPSLGVRTLLLDELISPIPHVTDERILAVALGLCMVLLSAQLLRGKRRAWKIAIALFLVSAVLSLVHRGEAVALVTSLVMLVILFLTRKEFTGLKDPPSLSQVVLAVPRYLLFVYGYGIAALWTQRGRLTPPWSWGRTFEAITGGLVGLEGPYTYRGRFATWFPLSLVVIGAIGVLLLLWLLLRPAVRVGGADGRARAEELVGREGWDTLSPFALRGDKSYFFSSDGRAMIAYGYLGGFALGSGDPIGEEDSIPLVVDEFIEHCRLHGWQPAFLAAREIDTPFYAERGFRSFYLGDEAVLDCRSFDLEAPGMAPVRQSVRRVESSHRYELLSEAAAGPELAAQLNVISDQWRRGEDERGYTMAMSQGVGSTRADRLVAVAWAVADDGSERPVGFLRLIPVGHPGGPFGPGYTLDLMRRLPDAANGIIEFLIARTAAELDDRGVARLSLNFAAFSRLLDDDVQHTRMDRFLRRVVDLLNPYYQIRSLREFNEKFQPEWLPRVLIYADPGDLPKVALRYAWVEGFVDVPLLGRFLSGPTEATRAPSSDPS